MKNLFFNIPKGHKPKELIILKGRALLIFEKKKRLAELKEKKRQR